MNSASTPPLRTARLRIFLLVFILCGLGAFLLLARAQTAPQAAPETVGRVFGDDIAVKGALNVEVENGRSTMVLGSGSEVLVRSGQARLELAEGGEIGVCGPAHFSLLKSGGAVTLALDYGRVHARLQGPLPLTIYTAFIVATPMAISDAPRDTTLGLETTGAMCVQAARGAVRIEQQLTGMAILVPQSGEISLTDGMLNSLRGSAGSCQCEILAARSEPPKPPAPPELSVPAPAEQARAAKPPEAPHTATNGESADKNPKVETREEPKPAPAKEEPVYKVMMPPLTFDASAPVPPPDPSPETILLVRRVRVRPAVVYRGHVQSPPPLPQPAPQPAQVAGEQPPPQPQPKEEVSVVARIRNFIRRIWNGAPAGDGGTAR